ncbi:MAG: DUF2177 family protein [Rhizobiaceae bacterium]|nr:DUF2177 family protein [Rhizobiaceae bacterium]
MKSYLIAYVATGAVFLGIDAIWLGVMAERLYRPLLGHVLVDGFNLAPAIAFYVLYIAGLMVFALSPAFASGKWTTAALYGALFGFFAYATYDLTNQATIKGWPTIITIADLCWGTFVSAVSATAGFLVTRYVVPSP